jgi:phosphatidylinositol alpha-mannosyltransferase
MLRIAVIQRFLPSRSRGGVGHFTHGLCNMLEEFGHRVTVFSQDPAPEDARYEVRTIPSNRNGTRRRVDPILFPFHVARQDFSTFDVIHAQGDDQFIPRRRAQPIVRTMHGSAWPEAIHNGLTQRSAKRFLLHAYFYACEFVACMRADETVAVSSDTRRYYHNVDRVIPNGISVRRFAERGEMRSPRPSVLFVGELESRKRGRLLIDVFQSYVRARVPDAELWLVCPEPASGDGVVWCGSVDDERLAALYRSAWVFCLPSSYEGFGRPYVEAMAAGAAVVATPNPGAREVLQDGMFGMIVNDAELGPALCRLLQDSHIREAFVGRAREHANRFSWEHVAREYEQVYEAARQRK